MTIRQKDSSFHLLIIKASLVGVKEMSAVGRNPFWKLVKKNIKKQLVEKSVICGINTAGRKLTDLYLVLLN